MQVEIHAELQKLDANPGVIVVERLRLGGPILRQRGQQVPLLGVQVFQQGVLERRPLGFDLLEVAAVGARHDAVEGAIQAVVIAGEHALQRRQSFRGDHDVPPISSTAERTPASGSGSSVKPSSIAQALHPDVGAEHVGVDARHPLAARDLHQAAEQRASDPAPLPGIAHQQRELGAVAPVAIAAQPSHRRDRPAARRRADLRDEGQLAIVVDEAGADQPLVRGPRVELERVQVAEPDALFRERADETRSAAARRRAGWDGS